MLEVKSSKARYNARGVTMLVVLGSIILFTLLGYVALTLSHKDSTISGDLVRIKSQRLAAISGFNLALSRLEANPVKTTQILNAFLNNSAQNTWLNFSDETYPVVSQSSEPDWWSLADGNEAVRVKILGVSATSDNGSVKVYLESYGRGKDGNIHIDRAMYSVHGLDYDRNKETEGPSNAFQSQGGVSNFYKVTTDGNIYLGDENSTTTLAGGTSLQKFRTAGSVNLNNGLDYDFSENAIIGGKFSTYNTNAITFQKSLIVKGGVNMDLTPMTIKGSFYVSGGTSENRFRKLNVEGYMRVEDQDAYYGDVTIGTPANYSSAKFEKGIFPNSTSSGNPGFLVYGDLYFSDPIDATLKSILRRAHIHRNLSYFGTRGMEQTFPDTIVGNANFSGNYYLNNFTNGDTTRTIFHGNVQFMDGLKIDHGRVIIKGETFLDAPSGGQPALGPLWIPVAVNPITFGNQVTINGRLMDTTFQSLSASPKHRWAFDATATNRTWSYRDGFGFANNPDFSADTIVNATSVTKRTFNAPAPTTWVTDASSLSFPTTAALGYTDEDLNLDKEGNPTSITANSAIPNIDQYQWNTLKTRWKSKAGSNDFDGACKHANFGDNGSMPNADAINCIYAGEKSADRLWNSEYLIVYHNASSDAWGYWPNGDYANPTNYELATGVKVYWIIVGQNCSPTLWFSNPNPNSIQILYTEDELEMFRWKGTYQGFIQFATKAPDHKIEFVGGDKLIGSIEFTDPDTRVYTTNNSAPLEIEYKTQSAQDIFSDIARNFTNQQTLKRNGVTAAQTKPTAVTGNVQPIILFSGDFSTNAAANQDVLQLFDGWIQFERLGEFR